MYARDTHVRILNQKHKFTDTHTFCSGQSFEFNANASKFTAEQCEAAWEGLDNVHGLFLPYKLVIERLND